MVPIPTYKSIHDEPLNCLSLSVISTSFRDRCAKRICSLTKEFGNTKGIIRSHKSKDRQCNCQNKKDKQCTTQKAKVLATRTH
jgi:hypothetical protein